MIYFQQMLVKQLVGLPVLEDGIDNLMIDQILIFMEIYYHKLIIF